MVTKENLYHEIGKMPPFLLEEIYNYICFLKTKMERGKSETALLSESALKKDWLKPEEDEAWKDL